jgi:DNA-directed RNA polymerase specialized sigma24 family protein
VAELTAESFGLLLIRLDADERAAAGKYEELRLKLVKFFIWQRRCAESEADALADETLDRVSAKLAQKVEILNVNAYALEVSRFVWLEYSRKKKEDAYGDDLPEITVPPETAEEPNTRLDCLKKCLAEVSSNDSDRRLILGYYSAADGEKNKIQRKNLAEKLGLTMNTLKVKACRLRERLERCINDCAAKTA